MNSDLTKLLRVRRFRRPDPLPDARGDAWDLHAPYLLMLLTDGERGLLACGAVLGFALHALIQLRLHQGCVVAHYGAGVLAVALFHGIPGAGAYALPAILFMTAALGARAATRYFAHPVAPMAGRGQWRLTDAFTHQSLRFGIAGISASLVGIALAPGVALKVLSVALLPLVLRTYMSRMLAPAARTKLWMITAAFEVAALLLLVPAAGAAAAPWVVVAGETILLLGSTAVVLERTGVRVVRRNVGIGSGAFLLVASVALPGTPSALPVLVVVLAALVWLIWKNLRID
jgi:hypothetical protein